MSGYGTAVVVRQADGTITVEQADRVIGVSRDLWDTMQPPHRREDGTLQLDTAGEYVYTFVTHAGDVLIFEREREPS